jgi:tetratricopeptide (TPR) repeat protein
MNRFQEDLAQRPLSDLEAVPAPQAEPAPAPHPGMRRRPPHAPIVPEYKPSTGERFGAAFRARRREIAAISALVVALVAGIVGTTAGMVRAARQRDAALAARADADQLRRAAEARQREAASVSEFLEAVLGSVNPWGADRAADVPVEQMLDVAAAKLDAGALAGQKDAEARVRATLGRAYAGLALPARAEPQLRRALELQRQLHPRDDHLDLAHDTGALATALLELSPPRTKEAEQLAVASLEMRRRLLGPEHRDVADALDRLSAVCRTRRDYYAAERWADEALAMRRRLPPDADSRPGLANSLINRASLTWRKGELTATVRDLTEAMENYRTALPPDHLLLGELHARLGAALAAAGDRPGAIAHFRQSVDVRRRHRPESHGDVVTPFRRLAVLTVEQGDYPAAEALLTDRDARLRALSDYPADLRSELCGHFVCLYQAWGKPQEMAAWSARMQESLGREMSAASERISRQPAQARPYFNRAKLRVRAGQFEEAAADYKHGLAIDGADHWPWYYYGCLLAYLGDELAYRQHCAAMLARFGSSSDGHVLDCTVKTCSLLAGGAGGDPERLNQIANQVWALGSKDERNVCWFRLLKGMAEDRAGSPDRAINWLNGSLAPDLPHRTATAELYLAMAHQRLGKAAEARALLAKAEGRIERLTPKAGVGDLGEGGIENWLVCQTALREARAIVTPGRASPTEDSSAPR